ncbi:unnamed protein product [Mytilus edulis]|uniref:SGNH hydrolase-type esterase domain-containing protein n=1 Tax=Mytilus edulis TaxID=6550 RepID=A0A8S3RCS9_MYTED|nr:unnamed protein product [Mytilus edulis]
MYGAASSAVISGGSILANLEGASCYTRKRAVVFWSCPYSFDYHSNWLGVGLTEIDKTHHRDWFEQMYYEKSGNELNFIRREYYYHTTISIQDSQFEVVGTMGTTPKSKARVKTIWLIGSSIVYWANKEASSRPGGLHLGLQNTGAHMIWIGQRGMKWGDLNRVFEQRLLNRPLPSFLVIQLGSNDLGILTSEKLFSDIECDLLRLHALYPALKIIWSDILMRRYWHNANCGQAIEKARKRVNLRVKNLVLSIGGCAIRHSNIRAKESNLFRYDGTHLSKIGNDIYLNNLQGALEQFMRSGGPAVFPQ